MNDQRRVIYEQRSDIMDSDDVTEIVEDMRSDTVNTIVADACPQGSYPEQWDIEGMKTRFAELLNLERSEEHTSELQSLMRISYAVFCLKKKTHNLKTLINTTTSIDIKKEHILCRRTTTHGTRSRIANP